MSEEQKLEGDIPKLRIGMNNFGSPISNQGPSSEENQGVVEKFVLSHSDHSEEQKRD